VIGWGAPTKGDRDIRPALKFAQTFAEHAGMIKGASRVPDSVVAKLLQRNPRIIRRHIRRYHRRNRLSPMLTMHTASGRLAYLLAGPELHDFIFFGLKLLDDDGDLLHAIMDSDHPACERFADWLCRELLPALDFFGLRGPPGIGSYHWPGTRAEFDRMITEAIDAAQNPSP